MNLKGIIPNALTMANLLCGALAIIQILVHGNYILAVQLMLLGAIFDFTDGLAARLLGVAGPLGKQLDSLADVISFGLVPALLACSMMSDFGDATLAYFPLIILVASTYRLGKFNIDENQSDHFIGLATPANALFWGSLAGIYFSYDAGLAGKLSDFLHNDFVILALSAVFSLLLISKLPLMALKFKSGQSRFNRQRIGLVALSVLLYLLLWLSSKNAWVGVPFVLLLYLVYSTIIHSSNKKQ